MNTARAFDKFDIRIDQYATGDVNRYEKRQFFQSAVSQYILNRIDPKNAKAPFSFAATSRLRTELGPLYVGPHTPTVTSGVVELPTNYLMAAYLRIQNASGQWKPCRPVSNLQAAAKRESPFFNGQEEPMYEETDSGLYIHAGNVNYAAFVPTVAELWYVKKPTEMTQSESGLAGGITIEDGATYHVDEGQATYDGTTYDQYETFTGSVAGGTSHTGSAAVSKITNSELPDHAMEEVVILAAYNYLITMNEHDKAQRLIQGLAYS